MRTKTSLLEKIYDRDPVSKAFIVRISINEYRDIFNDLDPAPLRKRDLDQDLKGYLEDCSRDIPLKSKIVLQFNAPKGILDAEKEQRVIAGLNTFFQFNIRIFRRQMSQMYKRSIVYILSSFILLSLTFYLSPAVPKEFLFVTLLEGLYIGGWVFLWEAVAIFVFKSRDFMLQRKRYQRLADAPIIFQYG